MATGPLTDIGQCYHLRTPMSQKQFSQKAIKPTWYKFIVLVNLGYVLVCAESIY